MRKTTETKPSQGTQMGGSESAPGQAQQGGGTPQQQGPSAQQGGGGKPVRFTDWASI